MIRLPPAAPTATGFKFEAEIKPSAPAPAPAPSALLGKADNANASESAVKGTTASLLEKKKEEPPPTDKNPVSTSSFNFSARRSSFEKGNVGATKSPPVAPAGFNFSAPSSSPSKDKPSVFSSSPAPAPAAAAPSGFNFTPAPDAGKVPAASTPATAKSGEKQMSLAEQFKSKGTPAKTWECCTLQWEVAKYKACGCCGTLNPTAERSSAKKKTTPLFVGAPPKLPAGKKSPTKQLSLAEQFATVETPDEWECCTLFWPADQAVCGCCESANPNPASAGGSGGGVKQGVGAILPGSGFNFKAPAPAPAGSGFNFTAAAPAPAGGGFNFQPSGATPAPAPPPAAGSGGFNFVAKSKMPAPVPAPTSAPPAVGSGGFNFVSKKAPAAPAAMSTGAKILSSLGAPPKMTAAGVKGNTTSGKSLSLADQLASTTVNKTSTSTAPGSGGFTLNVPKVDTSPSLVPVPTASLLSASKLKDAALPQHQKRGGKTAATMKAKKTRTDKGFLSVTLIRKSGVTVEVEDVSPEMSVEELKEMLEGKEKAEQEKKQKSKAGPKNGPAAGPIEALYYNGEHLQDIGPCHTLREHGMNVGAVVLHETELSFLLEQLSHIPTPELSPHDQDEILRASNMQLLAISKLRLLFVLSKNNELSFVDLNYLSTQDQLNLERVNVKPKIPLCAVITTMSFDQSGTYLMLRGPKYVCVLNVLEKNLSSKMKVRLKRRKSLVSHIERGDSSHMQNRRQSSGISLLGEFQLPKIGSPNIDSLADSMKTMSFGRGTDDTFKRQVCFFNGYQSDGAAAPDSGGGSPRRRKAAADAGGSQKMRFKSISISFDEDTNESVVKAVDTSITPPRDTPDIRVHIPDAVDQLGQKARNEFCRAELEKRFPPHEDFSERVVDCQWHPEGESHIILLTTDDMLHMYNVADPFERLRMQQQEDDPADEATHKPVPEFEFDLFKGSGRNAETEERGSTQAFCFGNQNSSMPGWDRFTLFVTMEGLQVYSICPVVPSNCQISEFVLQYLKLSIEREQECAEQNCGKNDIQMARQSSTNSLAGGTPTRSKYRGNAICTHESYSKLVASNAMKEKKEEYYLVDEWLSNFQRVKDYDSSGQYVGDKYIFKENGMRETMRCHPIKLQGPLIFGFDQRFQQLMFDDDKIQPEHGWRTVFGESLSLESLEVSSMISLSTSLASDVDERAGFVLQNNRRTSAAMQTPDKFGAVDMLKRLSLASPGGGGGVNTPVGRGGGTANGNASGSPQMDNVMGRGGKKKLACRLAAMSAVPVVLLAFPRVKSVAVLSLLQPVFPSFCSQDAFARQFPQNETELYFRRLLSPRLVLLDSAKLHSTNASVQCTQPVFTRDERDDSSIFLSNSESVHMLKLDWMKRIHLQLLTSATAAIEHSQSGNPPSNGLSLDGLDSSKGGAIGTAAAAAADQTHRKGVVCTALVVDSDCQFRGTISLPGCNFGHLMFVRRRDGTLIAINLTRMHFDFDERARKRELGPPAKTKAKVYKSIATTLQSSSSTKAEVYKSLADHWKKDLYYPPEGTRFSGSNEMHEVSAEHVEHFMTQTAQLKEEVAEKQCSRDRELIFKGHLEKALSDLFAEIKELENKVDSKCKPSQAATTVFDEKVLKTEQRQQELSTQATRLHHTIFESMNDKGVTKDLKNTIAMLKQAKDLENDIAGTELQIQGILKSRRETAAEERKVDPVLNQCRKILTDDMRLIAKSTQLLKEEIPQLLKDIQALKESSGCL
jgi:hypothetical protein